MDKFANNKIGLLGGTFDPIHNAHIEIALIAKQRFNLDEVHFIVAKDPPVKEQVTLDAERRFQLVTKVLESYEGLLPSRVELERAVKSYSYLTVQDYKQRFPDAELFWIMGADAFANLEEWKNFDYLKENLSFIVFSRTGSDVTDLADRIEDLKVFKVEDVDLDLSSTNIRERIKQQESLNTLVAGEIQQLVAEYYR